jgi:FtsP/CotA-like multicopper oxidase with cupredoxin domain
MKRRRFLELATGTAAGAVFHKTAFASLNRDQEIFLAIRDQSFGANDVVRVRPGERVRFHFLHAGGAEEVHLHFPGHRFTVLALDGNPVPTPANVDVLSLARGERIHATVEMSGPGNWTLGSLNHAERAAGLGVEVAYTNHNGPAQWQAPAAVDWSYARFSAANRAVPPVDQTIEMLLEKGRWIIDGQSHADIDHLFFQPGRQYRLRMMNATHRAQPVRLRGYNLQLTRVNQIPVSGIIKDTVRLERYNVIEADVLRRG